MKKTGFLLCVLMVVLIAWHPGMVWAQSGTGGAPGSKPGDKGNVITLQTLADSIKAKIKSIQPAVMEREWVVYRNRREALNQIRSPQNPETDLEFMLRTFW